MSWGRCGTILCRGIPTQPARHTHHLRGRSRVEICLIEPSDAVLAWGLMFLLQAEDQHRLIQRFAEILVPGGRLLFTSPAKPAAWNDVMTGWNHCP